jgi:Acetyltransferases
MVGFARLITDHVTFGYLTDVYVLSEHQGRGLGRWMMQCLNEVVSEWPMLRRCILFTRGETAARMYRKTIGMMEWDGQKAGLIFMERPGPGKRIPQGDGTEKEDKSV